MRLKDARHMSAEAQEALRYRVVNAVKNGMSKSAICSRVQGITHSNTLLDESYSNSGSKGIKSKEAGSTL